ncbi:MAG: hypothetical protein QME05_02990 [Candidatus Margulisbacteria bacterium]|nr:hypothetical protein [Candidatus Margulisiibacteriota bacterium]
MSQRVVPSRLDRVSRSVDYLKAVISAFGQKNFLVLLRAVRTIERGGRGILPRNVATARIALCVLGTEQRRWLEFLPFAVAVFEPGAEADHLETAASCIFEAVNACAELPPADQTAIKNILIPFALKGKKQRPIQQTNVHELAIKYQILLLLSPQEHIREQVSMGLELYARMDTPREKVVLAHACIGAAAQLKARRTGGINLPGLRDAADYFSHNCTEENISDSEGFEDALPRMAFLGFFAPIVTALLTRSVPVGSPQAAFGELCSLRALSENNPEDAAVRLSNSSLNLDETIFGRFLPSAKVVVIEINGRAISARFSREGMKIEDFLAFNPTEKGLRIARADNAELRQGAERVRARLLRIFSKHINSGFAYLCLTLAISIDPLAPPVSCGFVFLPNRNNLELCLGFFDETHREYAFRLCFRVTAVGGQIQLDYNPVIEGLSPQESQRVPFWVDYFCLHILAAGAGALTGKAAEINSEYIPAIEALLGRANEIAFLRTNQMAFAGLQFQFNTRPAFGDAAVMMDMNSRTRLARVIWEEFITRIGEGTYTLESTDFLSSLCREIRLRHEGEGKFPTAMLFELLDGSSFEAVLHSPDQMEIPGVVNLKNQPIVPFLLDLALEAGVVLFAPEQKRRGRNGKGETAGAYIGDTNDNGGRSAAAIRQLERLYARAVLARIQRNGLMGETWHYRSDGLFHPLEDQGPAAKREALAQYKPENLFVLLEPSGRICRLPVGRVRRNKELVFGSYERDPARERQQKILGDQRDLPTYYSLYVITEFSDGSAVAGRVALRNTQDGALDGTLLDQVQSAMDRGDFKSIDWIVKHISDRDLRTRIRQRLSDKPITIAEQRYDVFQVNTTFRIPPFVPLAALLERGHSLDKCL